MPQRTAPRTAPIDIRLTIHEPDLVDRLERYIKAQFPNIRGARVVVIKAAIAEYLDRHGVTEGENPP